MRSYAWVLGVLAALGMAGFPQEKQEKKEPEKELAEFKIPPEEVKRENPVKPTPNSLAQGKRFYGYDCAMCHGKQGDGKGELAAQMGLKLRDYREPATLKDLTDGEIFYIVGKGKGKMPGDEDRLTAQQRWHLVNFLRSLARTEATKPKLEVQP